MAILRAKRALRRTALSLTLLLGAAPAALADAPGYDFLPFNQPITQAAQQSVASCVTTPDFRLLPS
jgi:hypothetical protein